MVDLLTKELPVACAGNADAHAPTRVPTCAPIDARRRRMLAAGSAAAALALPLVGACTARRSTAGAMQRIADAAPCAARPDTLLVLLPGVRDEPADLVAQGFVRAVRERRLALDAWLVDAHLGYYRERSIVERLRVEVIEPARAAGYRRIVLAGISLGGFGALLYASTHAQQVQGVVALAPWLGPPELIDEIAAAGALDAWIAAGGAERDSTDPGRALWRWLHDARTRCGPSLFLGYGTRDRLAGGHRLLAPALPASNVLTVDGGHDWAPWRALWARLLDGPAFADIARGC